MMTVCAAVVIIIGGPPYHTIQLLVDHNTIPYHTIIGGPPYNTIRLLVDHTTIQLLEGHHTVRTAVVSDQIDEEATLCGSGTTGQPLRWHCYAGQPLRWHCWATTKNATQRITITHY